MFKKSLSSLALCYSPSPRLRKPLLLNRTSATADAQFEKSTLRCSEYAPGHKMQTCQKVDRAGHLNTLRATDHGQQS